MIIGIIGRIHFIFIITKGWLLFDCNISLVRKQNEKKKQIFDRTISRRVLILTPQFIRKTFYFFNFNTVKTLIKRTPVTMKNERVRTESVYCVQK